MKIRIKQRCRGETAEIRKQGELHGDESVEDKMLLVMSAGLPDSYFMAGQPTTPT